MPCALQHDDLLECEEFEPADEGPANEDPRGSDEGMPSIDVRGRNPIIPGGGMVSIYPGAAMTVDDATTMLRARPATIVVPVGPVKVGKSTLLGSLWEHVTSSPTDGWTFSASLTPYGFEDRCYLASFRSGLPIADQGRTSKDAERIILHLSVNRPGGEVSQSREILFADVSGEHTEEFVKANEPGPLLSLLRAAHVIAVLVDGDKFADPAQRWSVINETRALLRVMLERAEFRSNVEFVVVITKWDKCELADGIEDAVVRLESELSVLWPDIALLRMAARSEDESAVAEGTGVPEFLAITLREAPLVSKGVEKSTNQGRSFPNFVSGGVLLGKLIGGDH
jgi:GTP-binding protein EngB required for normal cell division